MTSRLVRWALWSPSHLAAVAGGALVVLLALALVFRPAPGDTGSPSEGAQAAGTATTGTVSPGSAGSAAGGSDGSAAASPGSGASSAATPGGSGTGTSGATPGPTATAADAGTVAATAAGQNVQVLFRDFTTRWLTGLGAITVPGWVDDVCRVGCTPFLEQMLGTVPATSIPDAKLTVVKVDEVSETLAAGRAQLSDGQWLALTAEWDGERWLVSGIEAA